MKFSVQALMFILTFIFTVISGPLIIPVLKKLKVGQTVRDDGPKTHLKKTGTPTMGGIIFLLPIIVIGIFAKVRYDMEVMPYILVTAGFGAIGFADDYIKVRYKKKDGLSAKGKMAGLFVVSALFTFIVLKMDLTDTGMIIPFMGIDSVVMLPLFIYVPFVIFFLLAMTNSVNLTDGVDGLAGSVTFTITLFLIITAMTRNSWSDSAGFGSILAGGCLGFLVYNIHPAKVFMGDTGSLALGGAIGALCIMMRMPWIILAAGVIYLLEALSVMIQIVYFKRTGKRVFKMAPIHHHFELSGWKEHKVVAVFVLITIVGCFAAFLTLRLNFFI